MNKLIIKVIAWIPAILMAFTIFGFSTQTGNESSGVSEKAARVIVNIVDSTHRFSMDEAYKVQLIEDLQFPIRKGAHMAEYMIFTLCVALGLCAWQIKWKKLIVYQFLLAFVFACTDEFHQLFVPDRSGKFTDVLIDSVGITVGVLIVYFVVTIISKRRKVKELKAEI